MCGTFRVASSGVILLTSLYHFERYLRIGDLGRIDGDGYIWITGRSKDLIIRGGHNIDPAIIEEALADHEEPSPLRVPSGSLTPMPASCLAPMWNPSPVPRSRQTN